MARSAAALAMLAVLCLASATGAAASTPEGLKFLEENGKKEGVVTLPSGLQYKARGATQRARSDARVVGRRRGATHAGCARRAAHCAARRAWPRCASQRVPVAHAAPAALESASCAPSALATARLNQRTP